MHTPLKEYQKKSVENKKAGQKQQLAKATAAAAHHLQNRLPKEPEDVIRAVLGCGRPKAQRMVKQLGPNAAKLPEAYAAFMRALMKDDVKIRQTAGAALNDLMFPQPQEKPAEPPPKS